MPKETATETSVGRDEPIGITPERLAFLLQALLTVESNYEERYGLVIAAMAVAHALGYRTGYRIDREDPDWPVAYLELPTGQVSWHMPQFEPEWDGHSTEEKHYRIACYCHSVGD